MMAPASIISGTVRSAIPTKIAVRAPAQMKTAFGQRHNVERALARPEHPVAHGLTITRLAVAALAAGSALATIIIAGQIAFHALEGIGP